MLDIPPVSSVDIPHGQGLHPVPPNLGWKEPSGQRSQGLMPVSENWPGRHKSVIACKKQKLQYQFDFTVLEKQTITKLFHEIVMKLFRLNEKCLQL